MTQYKACSRCGRIHPYNQPCPMKKPTYRYERTGADRLRFTSRWKRKSLQVRDDAHWMCELCRDQGKVTILWECTECGHEFETSYKRHKPEDA